MNSDVVKHICAYSGLKSALALRRSSTAMRDFLPTDGLCMLCPWEPRCVRSTSQYNAGKFVHIMTKMTTDSDFHTIIRIGDLSLSVFSKRHTALETVNDVNRRLSAMLNYDVSEYILG